MSHLDELKNEIAGLYWKLFLERNLRYSQTLKGGELEVHLKAYRRQLYSVSF